MIDFLSNDTMNLASIATFSSVSLAWIGRIIWRRIIKDNTEVAKDRAEINIIDTLQAAVSQLSQENANLRSTESELSIRLGRLEAKAKEVELLLAQIEKLHKKLDEKDNKIEQMIYHHAEESTRLNILLGIKDSEINELNTKVYNLEQRVLHRNIKEDK